MAVEEVVDSVTFKTESAQVTAQRRPTEVDGEVVDHWSFNLNQLGWGAFEGEGSEVIATSEEERGELASELLDMIEAYQQRQRDLMDEFHGNAAELNTK